MEETTILYSSLSFIFLIISLKLLFQSKKQYKNLPPSPPSLPIIGHIHLLKPLAHRFYHTLSQKYGPIFSLRLGSRLVVVISSPALAEECFGKNDIVLANRPKLIVGKHVFYNRTIMSSAPYGDHWRNLRRIAAGEIFSVGRLNAFLSIRRDEIRRLLVRLSRDSRVEFARVELKPLLEELMFNNTMRMVAGKRYYGDEVSDEAEAKEFRELIKEVLEKCIAKNPADFLPILKWFGQGYERKVKQLGKRIDEFLQKLVDEHRSKSRGNSNTMIDHLLSKQQSEPQYYTDQIIKGLILVILLAGIDTSVITIEWALCNLLNHPEILKKARDELDKNQIGQENLIDEPDLAKLPYLQSIIYETLRLHPPVALLLPHASGADCTISGYNVPRDTMIFYNAWAIHRDPSVWDDPESFKPERFETEKGESYKMLPFGLGRRACPGAGLAQRVVGLTLGSLIQCFEWKKIDGVEIDMTEGEGLTTPKVQPLECMCKARPIVNNAFYNGMD